MGENRKVGAQGVDSTPTPLTNQPEQEVDMAPSKSTKAPAFQFYPADFLNDDAVEDMTFTEIGVYVVMLCKDWLGKGLPADVGKIAARISSGKHQITEVRLKKLMEGPVSSRFDDRDGRLFNPRLEVERKKNRAFLRRQSDNGKLGGRPKQNPKENPLKSGGFSDSKARAREETNRDETSSVLQEKKRAPEFDGQKAFMAFQAAYPENRRKGGYIAQQAYFEQVELAGGPDELLDALANHLQSEQWRDAKHVPGMDVWLREERWRQRLEPPSSPAAPPSKWESQLPEWARKARAAQKAATS